MTHLTILTKKDLFSFLGLMRAEMMVDADGDTKSVTAVVKHDLREGHPVLKQFDTKGEALRNYEDAVATSIERGWAIVYRGVPLQG
jgi:hypothetical protein